MRFIICVAVVFAAIQATTSPVKAAGPLSLTEAVSIAARKQDPTVTGPRERAAALSEKAIADSQLAARVGASSLTATYRFLERLGHIAGPMIVAQLFLIGGQGTQVLLWMGSAVLAFGILFALPSSPGQAGTATREIAR